MVAVSMTKRYLTSDLMVRSYASFTYAENSGYAWYRGVLEEGRGSERRRRAAGVVGLSQLWLVSRRTWSAPIFSTSHTML